MNVSHALLHKLFSRFREGKPANQGMGRLPLRNAGDATEVESVVSQDRRQKVRYLAERTG